MSWVVCLLLWGGGPEALVPGSQPGVAGGRFKSQQTSRQDVKQPPTSQQTHKAPDGTQRQTVVLSVEGGAAEPWGCAPSFVLGQGL